LSIEGFGDSRGDLGDDVVLDGEDFVVEEGAVVLLNSRLGVLRLDVGDRGLAEEVAELVAVEAADSQLSNFGEELLEVVVGDLLLVDVPDLESHVRGSQGLEHSLGPSLGHDGCPLGLRQHSLDFLLSSGEPALQGSSAAREASGRQAAPVDEGPPSGSAESLLGNCHRFSVGLLTSTHRQRLSSILGVKDLPSSGLMLANHVDGALSLHQILPLGQLLPLSVEPASSDSSAIRSLPPPSHTLALEGSTSHPPVSLSALGSSASA